MLFGVIAAGRQRRIALMKLRGREGDSAMTRRGRTRLLKRTQLIALWLLSIPFQHRISRLTLRLDVPPLSSFVPFRDTSYSVVRR